MLHIMLLKVVQGTIDMIIFLLLVLLCLWAVHRQIHGFRILLYGLSLIVYHKLIYQNM